jgi:XTP/dITP diphosphohydrolase
MKICIASGNPHKIGEIKAIVSQIQDGAQFEFSTIENLNIPEPDEPYSSFMENAQHKAKYYASFTNLPTMSEDSGLCIVALDNYPGVYTKNFVQDNGGIDNAYNKLQELLKDKQDYSAYFFCATALYLPETQSFITAEGKYTGDISFPPRGDKGFAFDPIFIPHGYDKVMAELGEELKHKIGHRGQAIRQLFRNVIAQYALESK